MSGRGWPGSIGRAAPLTCYAERRNPALGAAGVPLGARAAAHFTAAASVHTQVPVEKRLRLDCRAQDTQRGGASGKLEGRRWRLLMLGRATYITPVAMGEPGSERLTAAAASSCEQRPGASSALALAEQPRLVALAAARLAVTHPSPWPPPAPPLPPDLAASSCTCRPP